MSKLISATGHRLTTDLERTDAEVRGLPDTASGRRLRQHRRALLEAVAAAGGRNLRVFGSVARGEDGPSSDVDLLVDLPEGTGLFALLELEGTLERILKVKVDLAPESSLKQRVPVIRGPHDGRCCVCRSRRKAGGINPGPASVRLPFVSVQSTACRSCVGDHCRGSGGSDSAPWSLG